MRKIRRKTEKLVDELKALRESRKSIDEFLYSHLLNFYNNCSLMHSFINNNSNTKGLFSTAYRQYFVFLVSCWETFFRDVFVYVQSRDEALTESLLRKMKPAIDTFGNDDVSIPELLSKSFNFQNLIDLEEAFDELFDTCFLRYVCSSDIGACGVNGRISEKFVVDNMFEDWYEIINDAFAIRHKVVHDANFRPDLNISFIQKAEVLFLIIPQIATQVISQRFNLQRIMYKKGDNDAPYIFTVSELLADDWEIE